MKRILKALQINTFKVIIPAVFMLQDEHTLEELHSQTTEDGKTAAYT